MRESGEVLQEVFRASRLGLTDRLRELVEGPEGGSLICEARDAAGRSPLHWAAEGGHEEACEVLLEADPAACSAGDTDGLAPLHLAAQAGHPMQAYQLACKCPAACQQPNKLQQTPIDAATEGERGEVLNAMLLACCGVGGPDALPATNALLARGAVPDTWAPNGSSALMLAASVDAAEVVRLLLGAAATVELQDALGRTAAMFAAGSDAREALEVLLDAGASVSLRDRRGRNVLDYAPPDSAARQLLEQRLAEMEKRAAELQEALLAELQGEQQHHKEGSGGAASNKKEGKKGGKKKKAKGKKAASPQRAAAPPAAGSAEQPVEEEQQQHAEEEQPSEAGSPETAEEEQAAPASAPADGSAAEAAAAVGGQEPNSATPASEGDAVDAAELLAALTAALPAGARPPSPAWQTVGGRAHAKQPSQGASGGRTPQSPLPQPGAGHTRVKRCPSTASLASTCSGESHDSDIGGSERCVLRHHSRTSSSGFSGAGAGRPPPTRPMAVPAALAAAAADKAGAPPGVLLARKPAWGKATPLAGSTPPQRQEAPVAGTTAVLAHQIQMDLRSQAGSGSSPGDTFLQLAPPLPAAPTAAAALQQPLQQRQHFVLAAPSLAPPAAALAAAAQSALAPALLQQQQQQEAADALALAAAQVAALQSELGQLRRQQAEAAAAHQAELAAVLADASQHEGEAVQAAVQQERLANVYRFAAFLQNNGLVPEALLAGSAAGSACNGAGAPPRSAPMLAPADLAAAFSAAAFPPSSGSGVSSGSPPGGFAGYESLGFPPVHPIRYPSRPAPGSSAQHQHPHADFLDSSAPLTTAAFSTLDMVAGLREEYSGNHSHFVVPASEGEGPCSPLPASLLPLCLGAELF